ncbi:DUF6615 family protein [Sphingobacterium daejeonense]|uniref:DUF6615 family protein n=1 Tax=Sphingobacterium daejeonense TaxID=371142 RepID=UPI003D3171E2
MLCNVFKMLSRATWNYIALSKIENFQLKEESLTDYNMLHLKLYGGSDIDVITFNKRQEGKNGADWEWWFNDRKRWLGFRVQAKIININTDEFDHLHYMSPTKAPQSAILILQSETATIPVIPLYCLYMATGSLDPSTLGPIPKELYGCAVMSAYRVLSLRPTKTVSVRYLQPYMTPWHQLVCNGTSSFDGLVKIAMGFLPDQNNAEVDMQSLVQEQPPAYVRFNEQSGVEYQDNEAVIPDLGGVVIVNLPETNTET